jgi:hypothetical protein
VLISFIWQLNGANVRKDLRRQNGCSTYEVGEVNFTLREGFPFTFYEESVKESGFTSTGCTLVKEYQRPIPMSLVNVPILLVDVIITTIPSILIIWLLYTVLSDRTRKSWVIISILLSIVIIFVGIVATALGERHYYSEFFEMYDIEYLKGLWIIFDILLPFIYWALLVYIGFWIVKKCIDVLVKGVAKLAR